MRQKVVWFVLGVLVGSLFVVSAYPQSSASPANPISGIYPINQDVSKILIGLKKGNFEVMNSQTLKNLAKTEAIPYAPIFDGNTLYAVKILPDGKFFIYAGTNIKDVNKFLNDAKREFFKVDWGKTITLKTEPSNFSWNVKINGKPSGTYKPEGTPSVSAHIESKIVWSSNDNWKPRGKLKIVWEIYRLADTDPQADYRVVDMVTYVWSGHHLYGDSGSGRWQIDTVKVYANVKPDGNDIFDLAKFGPTHDVNKYDSKVKSSISYTLGTGGASVTIQQVIKLFKIAVDTNGDWVRWMYTFNREEDDSYANSWIQLEPGYQFITNIPSSPTTAHQKLVASVEWTYNRPLLPDKHWTDSITIDWTWDFK